MDALYDTDILTWSEQQAALLRRVAAGERINGQLDWSNIIEEVESVGRSELQSCRSLLRQALRHMLKAEAWPLSRDVDHWQAEARLFRIQAAGYYTPSMRQKIDVATLYREAVRTLPASADGQPPRSINTVCPVTLDELLSAV